MSGKRNLFSIFTIFIIVFPLIDIFNGMLLYYEYPMSIGVPFRAVFLLFMIFSCFYSGIRKNFLTILVFVSSISFIGIVMLQYLFLSLENVVFSEELGLVLRYLLHLWIPLFIFYYKECLNENFFNQVFLKLNIIFTLGLLIPYFLGVGSYTYDNSAGFKGFYFATNDITYAFLILLFYLGNYLLEVRKNVLFYSILYLLNVYSLLLIGTKTGIFFGGIYTCVIVGRYFFSNESASLTANFLFLEGFIVVLLLAINKGKVFLSKILSGVVRRFRYFYEIYNGDFFRVITSERNVYLVDACKQFNSFSGKTFALLFGIGFTYRWDEYGRLGGLIEMDIFDTFFSYGLVGLTLLFISIIYFLINSQGLSKKLIIFTIIYSTIAGHVFYSALSASMYGLICGMAVYQNYCLKESDVAK